MTDASIHAPAGAAPSRWEGPAICWSAIFAGAFAALGLTIVLVVLGSAFGFGAMSPFADDGLSLTTIGVVTILWLIFTQIFASIAGGYLAGRMRRRWAIHQDEVFFRDSVHGFLTWAVASAFMFAVAGIAAAGGSAVAAAVTTAAVASEEDALAPPNVITDRLYRVAGGNPITLDSARDQAGRLVIRAIADEEAVTAEDRAWLTADVIEWTGMSDSEAEARVQLAFTEIAEAREAAKDEVDAARAASATLAIATALAMMIGAFVAAGAAVFGGRERDGLEDRLIRAP
ncbi:hypothetical protein ACQKH5_03690 [Hyphomonas sp. NPDC076900]|uniref:hypothetical protein n=1 Tax=unclassified Hyphomonas TaxID=2630699 RepID=UPI003D0007F0